MSAGDSPGMDYEIKLPPGAMPREFAGFFSETSSLDDLDSAVGAWPMCESQDCLGMGETESEHVIDGVYLCHECYGEAVRRSRPRRIRRGAR